MKRLLVLTMLFLLLPPGLAFGEIREIRQSIFGMD